MLKVYGCCLERVWVEDLESGGVTDVWTVLAQALKIITNVMMNNSQVHEPRFVLSQKDKTLVFKNNYCLMQVKSIAFCNTVDLH